MALKGVPRSPETRAKISASRMGLKVSDETRAKIAAASSGRIKSPETRAKIGAAHKGRVFSAETIQKMRTAHAGHPGTRNGQHHTEEAKALLRAARMNQVHPALARRGITIEQVREAEASGLKWCGAECKAFIPISDFAGKATSGKCKKCVAAKMQRRRDGLTAEQRASAAEYFSEWRNKNPGAMRRLWLKKYGVNQEWYDEKFAEQGGHCALCDATVDNRRMPSHAVPGASRQYLLVDHDHETGLARGLLCAKCNTALHRVEYVDGWALSAIRYLTRYGSRHKTISAPAQQSV